MRLDITGYIQLYFKVVSKFQIEHFYKNDFTLDIPSFKGYLFTGMILNQAGQYCPGLGWNLDAIDIKIKMIHKMVNCTKTFLKNFWNVEGVWKGPSSKLFDNCEWSQNTSEDDPEVELDFTTWEIWEKRTDQLIMGTVDPMSVQYCRNIFGNPLAYEGSYGPEHLVRKSASELSMLEETFQNLFMYVGTNILQ